MSSLKYIFVIEDNILVRKLREPEKETAALEQYTTSKEEKELRGVQADSSKTTEYKQGNKRNTTSRGK